MKKIGHLGVLILLNSILTAQINVPQVQKSLYTTFESTGCGNCGQYAIPVTNQVVSQVGSKAVFFSLHHSGSLLYSQVGQDIAVAFGAAGTPFWTLNSIPLGYYNASMQTTLINSINANYSATSTDVNTGFEWYIDSDTIYVETLTKFFNAGSGDYNVAVYISEDRIFEYQSNYDLNIPSEDIYHDHILRTSFSKEAFGVQIVSGNVNSGATYTNFHKIKIDPSWNLSEISLFSVVWKDNGGSYEFKNANDDGHQLIFTSVNTVEKDVLELNLYPNPVAEMLSVVSTNFKDNSLLRLTDMCGRIVYENKFIKNGEGLIKIDVTSFSSGKYIVSIYSEGIVKSKQFIVK